MKYIVQYIIRSSNYMKKCFVLFLSFKCIYVLLKNISQKFLLLSLIHYLSLWEVFVFFFLCLWGLFVEFVVGFCLFVSFWFCLFVFTVKEFHRNFIRKFSSLKRALGLKFNCNSHTKFSWIRYLCPSHLPSVVYFLMICIEFSSP